MDSGGTTLSVLRALPQVKLVGVGEQWGYHPLSTEGPTSGKTGWGKGGGVRVNSGGTTLSVLRALSQVKLVGVGEGG